MIQIVHKSTQMGKGESPISICRALETGQFAEYLNKVGQQVRCGGGTSPHPAAAVSAFHRVFADDDVVEDLTSVQERPQPADPNRELLDTGDAEDGIRASSSTTSYFHESIESLLNLLKSSPVSAATNDNDGATRARNDFREFPPTTAQAKVRRESRADGRVEGEETEATIPRTASLNTFPGQRSVLFSNDRLQGIGTVTTATNSNKQLDDSSVLIRGPDDELLQNAATVHRYTLDKSPLSDSPSISSRSFVDSTNSTLCQLRETLVKYYLENCGGDGTSVTLSGGAGAEGTTRYTENDTLWSAISTNSGQGGSPRGYSGSSLDYFRLDSITAALTANASSSSTAHYSPTVSALTTLLPPFLDHVELRGLLFGNDSIMGHHHNAFATTLLPPLPGPATSSSNDGGVAGQPLTYHWNFLFFVIIFIIAGGLGNILVCLAIALDRKLQNVTNYFLLSLAIADLLVSLFVMPLGAIPTFLGKCHNYRFIVFSEIIGSASPVQPVR